MAPVTELLATALAIGVGATAIMDLWGAIQKRAFSARPLDYALVGRWLGHMLHGQVRHDAIAKSPPVAGERLVGWVAHYLTGVAFAVVLLTTRGIEWARNPSLAPALLVGVCAVVFPFFLMQPAFGAGIAGSRTPNPGLTRVRSLITHCVFGAGLYLSAWLMNAIREWT